MSKKSRKEEQEREDPTASAITALLSSMLAVHKAMHLTDVSTSYARVSPSWTACNQQCISEAVAMAENAKC